MIPPAWIVMAEVFEHHQDLADDHTVIAQEMVAALERRGWSVVPSWTVNREKLSLGFVVES